MPLPDVGWTEGIAANGWWKVGLFGEELGDLSGDAVYLDLDVVFTGSLNELFELPGDVLAPRDYRVIRAKGAYFVVNSSVLRFSVGRRPEVLELFQQDFPKIRRRVRNDHEFLSHYFHPRGLLANWPPGWCPRASRRTA